MGKENLVMDTPPISWTWDSLKAFITSPMIFKLVTTREKLPGE